MIKAAVRAAAQGHPVPAAAPGGRRVPVPFLRAGEGPGLPAKLAP